MIEFIFGYFLGKEMQKDAKSTMVSLLLLPFLLAFCFWAYFAFIDFSKMVWNLYLTYEPLTTTNIDFMIIGVLIAINFLVEHLVATKTLKRKLLLLLIKSSNSFIVPWIAFDLIYKMQFMGQLTSVLGNGISLNEVRLFSLFDGLSPYHLIVGSIGIGTILLPFVTFGMFGYLVYSSMNPRKNT